MDLPTSLVSTAAALRSGELDLVAYLEGLCDHIDAAEPKLRALVPEPARRPRLLAEAAALHARFPDPAARPLLYGIPVGVKDIFRVDGFETRAGSALPPGVLAGAEAACVTSLRTAGALILGKTVTAEFAYFEPGPTRNPRNPEHTPGGSSSGSAAGVAAGYCPLALGTQTIGSIIRPAAFCGVVGFKPTFGRIDTSGLIFCAPSFDHVGLFTREVAGMKLVASLLCAHWVPSSAQCLPVLGVPDGAYLRQADREGRAAFERLLERLQSAGVVVRHVSVLDDIASITQRHVRLMMSEMAAVHEPWFATYESLYRQRTAAAIREGRGVPAEELEAAREGPGALRKELEGLMDRARIDLWASPAAPGPAPRGIGSTGNSAMNLPWTHAGLPAITIPAGVAENGLPLGLQLAGRAMSDEHVLEGAGSLEVVLGMPA